MNIKRISRKLFYHNLVFNFYLDHIRDDLGQDVREYFVMQPKNIRDDMGGGVAVLPVIDGKIGLINIYRPAINASQWEIPHGFVEPDESDNQAAARELEEETGLIAPLENYSSLGFVTPDAGVIAAHVHLFSLESHTARNESVYELGIEQFKFFEISEIRRMIECSEIRDGFTIAAIFKFLSTKGLVRWDL